MNKNERVLILCKYNIGVAKEARATKEKGEKRLGKIPITLMMVLKDD